MEVDPYEARLFQMFTNCDKEGKGLLNEDDLRQLCEKLELHDKGDFVLADLLGTKLPITYELFKESLLNFLNGGGNDTVGTSSTECLSQNFKTNKELNCQRTLVLNDETKKPYLDSPPDTSDREVSPKLVMGSKKYGRRSRPPYRCSKETLLSDSDEDCILVDGSRRLSKAVERSSSQTDITSNENWRTTEECGAKVKRCASLPAQRNLQNQTQAGAGNKTKIFTKHKSTKTAIQKSTLKPNHELTEKQLNSSVESLGHETLTTTIREVWQNYSAEIGSSYLTCKQLRVICERLGLQTTLAERVALESFEQLHVCQYNQLITLQDFIKLLTGTTQMTTTKPITCSLSTKTTNAAADETHEIFDSNKISTKETATHMETLPVQSIIDIWERASIPNGRNILIALGFDEIEICLAHLYKVIDEEARILEEEQAFTLLRASSVLQTAELTSVRQLLRQVHDENIKLRADNKEANQRVALMAIEIDERHALLEENSKKEVKTLEQRHANAIRDLTAKIANDRENWNNLTAKLEAHIKTFEQEEVRLKTELESMRKENEDLESKQLNLFKENEKLLRKIADLSALKAQSPESVEKPKSSTDKTKSVNVDNAEHDDELVQIMEKLEALRIENHKLRDKNDELVAETETLNMELQRYKAELKKRSTLGASTTMTASYTQNDSSLEDMELENISTATKRRGDSPSKAHITEESPRTGKLRKCGNDDEDSSISEIALNTELQQTKKDSDTPEVIKTLRNRVDELEKLLKTQSINDELVTNTSCAGKCEHATYIERCKELEASLEQMAAAFDDFETDWQSKVNNERQTVEELEMKLKTERQICEEQRLFYEDVQQESDKKFTELMEKVREYEDQFNKENRLTPIEERDTLEQQYAEIEIELKEERDKNEAKSKELESMKKEIEALHNEIENLRLHEFVVAGDIEFSNQVAAMNQQHDPRNSSPASSPISYLWHQSTIQHPAKLLKERNATSECASASNSATTSPNRHKNCLKPNSPPSYPGSRYNRFKRKKSRFNGNK